jgi:sigma-B regulation protein RsbU (phosphoserine phosphatase)
MRFSLSAKLALLLLASLSCVLIPLLAIVYVNESASLLRMDKERFMRALRAVEEHINAGFLHLNEAKLVEVMRAKEKLKDAAQRFANMAVPAEAPVELTAQEISLVMAALRRGLISRLEKEGVLLDTFQPASLAQGPQTRLGLHPELTDFKGQSLREMIAKLPPAGDFSIYRLPGHGPMLAYFLPASGVTVVCASSIQLLEDEAEAAVRALKRVLEERIRSLSLHKKGFIALLDDSGAYLAGKGVFGHSELASLTPVVDQVRASGAGVQKNVRLKLTDGTEAEYLVAMAFSRPFRWFTVMAAPLAEISASSRALLWELVAQSLGIGLAALLLSLLMLRRAIRPLRLLLPKLTTLPDMDFSSPQAGSALADDLPLDRRDEVGDLARSFAAMGERLQVNVRALVESSAIQERMRGELDAAREIQRGILPPPELAPNIFGISSSAMLESAREVGGDLYYFFTLPDGRHAFVIGDVSGKGVPAALFMAITVTMARHTLAAESDLGVALGRINALLEAHNPQTMFVTLFLVLYDPADGRLDYANGGHNLPLLVSKGAVIRLDGVSGPMVGVMPGAQYQSFSRILQEGELCLLYTDGVTEAVNEAGEIYGEERLEAYLASCGAGHPKDLLNGIFADVKLFRGRAAPFDDITMLAFARR